MRNIYICIILITLYFNPAFKVFAQTYRLLESSSTLKGPKHEILPRPNGDILTITHPNTGDKGPMTVSRFDDQLNEIYTRRITLLSHECYQAAWYDNDRLFLFCTDKLGGLTRYEIDENTGSLTGQPAPLTGLLGIVSHPKNAAFLTGNSPDGAFHYIVSSMEGKHSAEKTIRGLILNRHGEKTALFQYAIPATTSSADLATHADRGVSRPLDLLFVQGSPRSIDLSFVQGVDGTLSMIYGSAANYTLVRIGIDGKPNAFPLSGLPDGNFRYVSWVAEGETLRFSGLLSRTRKTNFTAIVTGSVDLTTGTVFNLRQTEVATLMAQAPPALRDRVQNGFPADLTLLRTLTLSDASRVVLFESSGQHLYQNHFSPATQNPISAFGRSGTFTSSSPSTEGIRYQSRGDVYVLKLDRDNVPQWLNVLSKNQEASEKTTAIGIGCLADQQDNLHIFFYDSKYNADAYAANPTPVRTDDPRGNEFACISITPDGAMKKQFIPITDQHYRLMPELAFVDNKNEACFLAVKTKMSITEQLASDNNGYKLGTIAVK